MHFRSNAAGAAEDGQSNAHVLEVGGVASFGLHDPGGWGREAQSGAGEAGGAVRGIGCRRASRSLESESGSTS